MTDTEITVCEETVIELLALLMATSSIISDIPHLIGFHTYLASMIDGLSEQIFGDDYSSLSEIDVRAWDIEADAAGDIERLFTAATKAVQDLAEIAALN